MAKRAQLGLMSDRIDEEIHGLIKIGNFKACIEKVESLKKQLPKSSYLRVLEIYVKYKQSPGKFNYEASLGKFYGINGTEVTSDTRALNLLHKLFIELEKYDEALHVYERANFKYSGFEVALQWFEKALDDSNYKQMTKACRQLAKTGGNGGEGLTSRDYYFWYSLSIVSLFKFQSQRVTEQEKKLLPQLAYRSLCDLKPFRSAQEVYVFCTVCEELFEKDEKSHEIVQEVLPQLEGAVDLHLKNFLVRNFKKDDHQMTFEVYGKLLQSIDDFELILLFIRAGKSLAKKKKDILQDIESLVGDSRNSRLAHLEVDSVLDNEISDEALDFYLQKYHNKPCCAVDLNRYRDLLDDNKLKNAFGKFEAVDVLHDTNLFKLGISELSPVEGYNKHQKSLNDKPVTDYSTCSVYILKLVNDLILDPSMEKVLLALSILENYRKYDPHNYDTSVWVIALYIHLGCIPLAYEHYLQLKIKSVQIDTTDFLMYSHFSTLFPSKPHDFIQRVQENFQKFCNSSVDRLSQFIQIGLERKSYSKILGMLEFRDRLERSTMRWLLFSENIQLARLCNDKRGEQLQNMHKAWRKLEMTGSQGFSDNRDWEIFSRGMQKDNLPAVLQYLNLNDKSVALKCIREFMIELIPSRQTDQKLDAYLEELVNPNGLQTSLNNSLDPSDAWSFEVFYDLYKNDGANMQSLLEKIDIKNQESSTWRLSHEYLTRLHTLKTLDSFKRVKDTALKRLIKNKTNQLRENCDDLYSDYMKQLTNACEKLNKGQNAQLLKSLSYVPLNSADLKSSLLTVQKTVRNL